MEGKKYLFIEGEPNSPNGDLCQGFSKLLAKKLGGKLPRIVFGGGKTMTVRKYLKSNSTDTSCLLIDLDAHENEIENDLMKLKLSKHKDNVCFMIQEMESWFISQPEVLDKYYGQTRSGKKVSEKLPKKKPTEIGDPKGELKSATRDLNKGEEYHEVKHAIKLLTLLDADKLEDDFPDFKKLIEKLR